MATDERGLVPVPDPTLLTTEQLRSEIAHLKELLTVRVDGLEDRVDTYHEAHAEKHRERQHEVAEAIEHLTELCAERFAGVQTQLVDRDARVKESAVASQAAVDAALAAQKEAVAKSELATKEQIASIKTENATTVASLESKIENVKELLTASTGRGVGLDVALSRTFTVVAIVIAAVAVAVSLIIGTR